MHRDEMRLSCGEEREREKEGGKEGEKKERERGRQAILTDAPNPKTVAVIRQNAN